MGELDGKVAIVTGGAGGMGQEIALLFARNGARVAVADLAPTGEVVERIAGEGGTAVALEVDVSDSASVQDMVRRTVAELGPLDCAVNGAAIEGEGVMLADLDEARFDRIIAVNLRSAFLCLKYEIKAILEHGRGGALVNIASTNSFRPLPTQTAYTASKHGVIGVTKTAAIEYGPLGIRINAVAPGATRTPMLLEAIARREGDLTETAERLTLPGRFGEPAEVAEAALWLCSDRSSFTYGHVLAVDGGYLAR
ncbi:MAG: SDR family NAD(P)-dependent oxidoreductase [Acidimicrobiia bacterium]